MAGEFIFFVIYVAQQLGIMLGVGSMTVLGHHMPLITTLKPGEVRVRTAPNAEPQIFPISGGVLEVRSDGATVIL